ncbi:MAG: response regulator [Spirochaetia bacterium]|nr:response regulator [Spirochaetia bacterium]
MDKKVVMTIDDSSAIRQAIKEILSENNYYVIEARHGRAALDYLNGKKVDLILLDLNMPEMDGYEFLKTLRGEAQYSAYTKTPIIILTTETDKSNKETAKQLGAYGWITKPFNPASLIAIVKEHCL